MQFGKNGTLFVILAIIASATAVHAGQMGGTEQGLAIAREICADCHLVVKERGRSKNENAPTFAAIANTPGMTAAALRAALNTSHRKMPNLVLKDGESDSIIAYILSLKDNQ